MDQEEREDGHTIAVEGCSLELKLRQICSFQAVPALQMA